MLLRCSRSVFVLPWLTAVWLLLDSGEARGHAFGARYDLPLPLGFYLFAAGAAVALTFAVLSFARPQGQDAFALQRPLRIPTRVLSLLAALARMLGILAFLLILWAAFFGDPSPTNNPATLIVWVLWWVGFSLFTAFLGNLWPLLDPWSTLFAWSRLGWIVRPRPLQQRFGGWIAVLLFLVFAWCEMVGSFGEDPASLGWLILGYSAITWSGMTLFGREAWLETADPFHRFFALLGRFAILGRGFGSEQRIALRAPALGLTQGHPRSLADIFFIMAVLASVTFDGFSETPLWMAFLQWLSENTLLRPLLLYLQAQGLDLLVSIESVALILAPLSVFLIYLVTCVLAVAYAGDSTNAEMLRGFALTLLPIAIAYHLAHYFSYLALAGQYALPLISDPFGLGWDLFGTKGHVVDVGIVNAKMVWYLSVSAIVTGHVISVILAHLEAVRLFSNERAVLRSQVPITLLMVGFTMASLWILAQPVVE